MKEIGEALKEARENMGISIEEASNDLKLRPSQIENIESGNLNAFKDIFYLKYFIRDYSKYLGLNYEDMIDEFNEYLFDYTSKISLDDIKQAQKKVLKKEKIEKRIASPYTLEKKSKFNKTYIMYGLLLVVLISLVFLIVTLLKKETPKEVDNLVAYLTMEENNEFTK
ncbi:MAG: helix-turn-helix domain-containing protein [Bacilli bacterium]